MKLTIYRIIFFTTFFATLATRLFAQGDAKANARLDGAQLIVGDQARLFIEVQHNDKQSRVQWAVIPDTVNDLEVVEKGKIDTVRQGDMVTYKQRLLITGFDSGVYKFPALVFPVIPNSGTPYTIQTDSFNLLVQTVAVDTTKPFKGIKDIMYVKSSWLDYIWYIIGGIVFILLVIFAIIYFIRHKKTGVPLFKGPAETLQEKTLRYLAELEQEQLWQKGHVKEYYTQLTDIVRDYIEARFHTPAMELTTDDLLYKVRIHKELQPYQVLLATILNTADLAKFAKAQPLPQEHTEAMESAKQFVSTSKPAPIAIGTENTKT